MIIRVRGEGVGEFLKVRCNLSDASSPVEVNYLEGSGWESTQYQCWNTRHTPEGLAALGEQLLCEALQDDEVETVWNECKGN